MRKKPKRVTIHKLSEIPHSFASEDEEREWWATHELSDELYDQLADVTAHHHALIRAAKEKRQPVKR